MTTPRLRLLEPGRIGIGDHPQPRHQDRRGRDDVARGRHRHEGRGPGLLRGAWRSGGTGLIIVESPTVDYPAGCRWRERYRLDDDKFIPGMAQIADVIHKHGCPTFMQMNHDGTWQVNLPFVPDPPY